VSVLGFRQRRIDPDPTPTPEPLSYHNPNLQPEPDPNCTCRADEGRGQNPVCTVHPWWRHDPTVLHLADLTRERGSAWDAARAKFGGGA
jgi:hypothetical protein